MFVSLCCYLMTTEPTLSSLFYMLESMFEHNLIKKKCQFKVYIKELYGSWGENLN